MHSGGMGARSWAVVACAVLVSCRAADNVSPASSPASPTARSSGAATTATLVLVGDVMLGRGVAPAVAADPTSVFERLRPVLVDADVALGNLESPLTTRPHLTGGHALEADPSAAAVLAGAGFDVMSVANNHATDAGRATVLDTLGALSNVGLRGVGGGATATGAAEPLVIDVAGISVGIVAFDAAGGTAATAAAPGVSLWDGDRARDIVTELRRQVDVVVVGLHAGVELLLRPDPLLARITDELADWGADVVWGHGAHVAYPVEVRSTFGRPAVVAPGLGNALFDQRWPRTRRGAVLEVLVDRDGAIAMRTGTVRSDAGRSVFEGWDVPTGDAVALDGDWWTPVRPWTADRDVGAVGETDLAGVLPATYEVVASASGDVTGSGEIDTVTAYRRPATPMPAHEVLPEQSWLADDGRSAHLAVYTATGRMRWGAGVLMQPVGALAVCTGSMALGFTTLDDPSIVSGGAWIWDGFGFRTSPVLPGGAVPGCADVDHDGRSDPLLIGRG